VGYRPKYASSVSLVIIEKNAGVVTLTLNRPERRNALTIEMLHLLCGALQDASNDTSVRVVVLRGAGSDFSSGFDLKEGQELENSLTHGELLCRAQLLLADSHAVTVAAVSGYALAGGGALIASCDYAVCTEDAKFGYPVLKVGIVPTPGMPFLRQELSDRNFRALVLGGELMDGNWALQAGLANKVVATIDDAMAEAQRFSNSILQSSPAAVLATKRFANQLTRDNLHKEMQEALTVYKDIRRGAQAAEGLAAFNEKRSPNWIS